MNGGSTVFVVDDDPLMLRSLRWLFESEELPVQTFESAVDFLATYRPERPGCMVLDIRMPGMSGLDLQDHLREKDIDIPIIFITAFADVKMAVRAMKAGAIDFMEKPAVDNLLVEKVHNAIALDDRRRQVRARAQEIAKRMETLTEREAEVVKYVIQEISSNEIANQLGVSPKTIEVHRAKIMKNLHTPPNESPESEWTKEKNRRRCELVDKEIEGILSFDEKSELEKLQAEMLAYRRKVAPLPINDLRELHQELLQKPQELSE